MRQSHRRNWLLSSLILVLVVSLVVGCTGAKKDDRDEQTVAKGPSNVFYEIFVRSFYDTNGDGIGDLNGVTAKLDYLQDLGVSGLWLMPIFKSPSYHGYDVTDYYEINPEYGTLDDLKKLLEEAHKRDIKIVLDMIVNHSSDRNPWFIESASSTNNPKRNWYVWAEDQGKDPVGSSAAGAGNAWHERNDAHYLGIFWGGMPDFNLDEPEVRQEMIKIGQYWLEQGVDGFRLDAAKHVYEDFTGTGSQPAIQKKNQKWWQEYRSALEQMKPDVYLVGEVWDSTAKIGPYLDHALDSCFNFDLALQLINTAKTEVAIDIGGTLERSYEYYNKMSDGKFVDSPFLTNHDQNRVMSQLSGNIQHAKMAAAMLLTLPGTPYIYYGEEIGMKGFKPDEKIREPMIWYKDGKHGEGQTTWEALDFNADNPPSVESQLQDEQSLLSWYRTFIQLRKQEQVLNTNAIASYKSDNSSVAAFVRTDGTKSLLVLHNLSGTEQTISWADSDSAKQYKKITFTTDKAAKRTDKGITLPPYSSVILN